MADREQLLAIVRREGALKLEWTGPDCAVEKYCAPLRPEMRARGHRAGDDVRFSWCAAFCWWCLSEAGYEIPIAPEGHFATMALVDAWRWWARKQGLFTPVADPRQLKPWADAVSVAGRIIEPGDLLTMTLPDEDTGGTFNHIGFYLGPGEPEQVATGEGNRLNRTALGERPLSVVDGVIRLPG